MLSQTTVTAQSSLLRESEPGLGGGIDACINTANEQMQHPTNNNNNNDADKASKMHPPGARRKHQQQPGSSSGPPPKKRTTQLDVGGGHPVKRVGTDTRLSPPHDDKRRRITGKTGPRSD